MSSHHDENEGSTDISEDPSSIRPLPPTLKPFLDNLPTPVSLNPESNISPAVPQAFYGRTRHGSNNGIFVIGEDEQDEDEELEDDEQQEDEDEDEDEDGDENEDDDEGFDSQESRHNSSASSVVSNEGDVHRHYNGSVSSSGPQTSIRQVQRVSSMPNSSPVDQHHGAYGNLHMSRSTTALLRGPPPLPPPLYPPFYNKPPTPLPPSPSLTSLLRPPSLLNRSTTSTRPTTPDSSDVETPNDTEAAVAQSARRANPLPPTAPKVPTYEYYGFVLYLASSLAFLIYILWSYLPSPFLHALGITYYPNRWWSLAIPAWIVMLLIYIYIALACWNVEYMTLGLERVETMVDEAGSVAILDENGRIRKGGSKRYVAELEEKRRRENMMHTWERKKKGGHGSARGSKKKDRKDREKEEEWFGYIGETTSTGLMSGLSWRQVWNDGTDAVLDVPIGGVCEVLYGDNMDMY